MTGNLRAGTGMVAGALRGGCTRAAAIVAAVALAGCNGGPLGGGAGDGAGRASGTAQTVELVERDVEAPEVFQVTALGLWDGRPSLGGVWVAHPQVSDPERVIIRNQATGAFVIGALFRRERDNPGPPLQVSSDAAEALGMLAGAPAELNVTALRRQEAPQTPPEGPATTDFAAPETIAAAPAPAAAAMAAPAPATPSAGAVATTALAPAAPASAAAAAPAPAAGGAAPDRPFIQLGIFSVEENAQNLARQMSADGLAARVIRSQSQGRTFWRVVVGPAASTAERDRLLERVKAAGFADAYFVRN